MEGLGEERESRGWALLLGFRVRGYGAYGVDSGEVLGFAFFFGRF